MNGPSDTGTVPVVVLVPDDRGASALAEVPGVRAVVYDTNAALPSAARDAEVLVARGIDPARSGEWFRQLPGLRMVQLFSAGSDQWRGRVPTGVQLSNLRGVHGAAVSEWIVAELLARYRDLDGYRDRQHRQHWDPHRTATLRGASVLVFGAGDIAENTRRRLEPFDASVSLVGTRERARIADPQQGRALLGTADIVVLALPDTPATRGMVDARFLSEMADGTVLVNVGRGTLVDTDALLAELENRRLTAILDVTDPEPLPSGHRLWSAPGAVISPHAAGLTTDIDDRCWTAIVERISSYLAASPDQR